MPFMGGWHAFPGGGLSRADREIPVDAMPPAATLGPADGAMPAAVTDGVELDELLPAGLVACALRELFEETGILLASPLADSAAIGAVRERLLAKDAGFVELLAGLGSRLTAERLVFAGRWLTPPMGPIRFDNRFFLLE